MNTSSICDANYKEGLADGASVCREPRSEIKRYDLSFSEGQLYGPFRVYDRTDKARLVAETQFSAGLPDGKEEIFGHDTQRVVFRMFRKNGAGIGTEEMWDDQTGALIGRDAYVDGKIEGEVVRYAPDGKQLLAKAHVKAGKRVGLEEAYYPNGKPRFRGNWVDGQPDGHTQSWSETGEVTDRYYENGVQVMPPEYRAKPTAG
jgi:antitoxin component YwqK of YwqJK toxin-antitoxin module